MLEAWVPCQPLQQDQTSRGCLLVLLRPLKPAMLLCPPLVPSSVPSRSQGRNEWVGGGWIPEPKASWNLTSMEISCSAHASDRRAPTSLGEMAVLAFLPVGWLLCSLFQGWPGQCRPLLGAGDRGPVGTALLPR